MADNRAMIRSLIRAPGRAVLAAGLLALAGCGGFYWPLEPTEPRVRRAPARPAVQPAPPEVTVASGDSVYRISRRYGIAIDAIIEANRLTPPYVLQPGQRLRLPRVAYHEVVRGETLYGISRRYGLDVYALARANRLGPPYRIRVGQQVRLPGRAERLAQAPRAPVAGKTRAPSARQPVPPTLARPQRKPARPSVPAPPRRAGGGFLWPVKGRVLSRFGPKGNGLHNDGINIAARPGTPVRAVESGVVAYAGNELRGFGNLVLIKHAGGWVTAYAHNRTLLVRRGQRVGRGEAIARVGATGNVKAPQLHFELRRGRKAVDPLRHLRRQVTSRLPRRPARS